MCADDGTCVAGIGGTTEIRVGSVPVHSCAGWFCARAFLRAGWFCARAFLRGKNVLSMEGAASYHFSPVGVVHSCYRTKFGIPRQSGLIEQAEGTIELLPPYNQPNIIRGLETFSHIWIIFLFHQNLRDGWKATVRPPRLGGDRRLGVFATRSSFRPVPIGLSAVKLEGIEQRPHGKLLLKVRGLDLVDGTPVLDIKPYLPYADAITGATGGFAPEAPESVLKVTVAPEAAAVLERRGSRFRELCLRVVAGDPRPAYQRIPGREYQCYLEDCEVVWEAGERPDEAHILRVNEHVTPSPLPSDDFSSFVFKVSSSSSTPNIKE